MRASTLFALFIAVMIGLAGLAAARYFGVFRTPVVQPQPVVQLPKVLVAKKNLYEDIAMTPGDVEVRELTADEYDDYRKNPEKYLSARPEAASMRVLNRNVGAGQILYNEYLTPQVIPKGVGEVLPPGMVAVHVEVTKDRANGGLIRIGDHVDVYLSTKIEGSGTPPVTRSGYAPIARGLPVIFKRDMLWPVVAPVPEGKPLAFTLAANPYRAALIEYAKSKGQLTLVPISTPPLGKGAKAEFPTTWDDPASEEYKNEDKRIAALSQGNRSISDADLESHFPSAPTLRYGKPIDRDVQGQREKRGSAVYGAPLSGRSRSRRSRHPGLRLSV